MFSKTEEDWSTRSIQPRKQIVKIDQPDQTKKLKILKYEKTYQPNQFS